MSDDEVGALGPINNIYLRQSWDVIERLMSVWLDQRYEHSRGRIGNAFRNYMETRMGAMRDAITRRTRNASQRATLPGDPDNVSGPNGPDFIVRLGPGWDSNSNQGGGGVQGDAEGSSGGHGASGAGGSGAGGGQRSQVSFMNGGAQLLDVFVHQVESTQWMTFYD